MFLIRLLMRLCFSWQYVLIIRYDGAVKIRRAKYRSDWWRVGTYRKKTAHTLQPQGVILPYGHYVGWLPLTPPMRAVYHQVRLGGAK